jgi:hypothetical protein
MEKMRPRFSHEPQFTILPRRFTQGSGTLGFTGDSSVRTICGENAGIEGAWLWGACHAARLI